MSRHHKRRHFEAKEIESFDPPALPQPKGWAGRIMDLVVWGPDGEEEARRRLGRTRV